MGLKPVRKKAAEVIIMKSQKPGVLPANILYEPNPLAGQTGMGYEVDEEDVINFIPYTRKEKPLLTSEQRESFLKSQRHPNEWSEDEKLKAIAEIMADTFSDWDNDDEEDITREEVQQIEEIRKDLPEGRGGWDPTKVSDINPRGAHGNRDWWIKHGDPEGTDGLGDGSWKTGPRSEVLDPMQDDIQDLKDAFRKRLEE